MNKSGPSEFNYMPCIRHFSWCSFLSGSHSAAHLCGLRQSLSEQESWMFGYWWGRSLLWAFLPLYFEHFANTFTSGTLLEKLLCKMQALQLQQIVSYCPQLSPEELKDWIQIPSRCSHWLSGKGLTSLVSWNLGADRTLKREDGPWSLLITIKI